jgi:hypothetical protein
VCIFTAGLVPENVAQRAAEARDDFIEVEELSATAQCDWHCRSAISRDALLVRIDDEHERHSAQQILINFRKTIRWPVLGGQNFDSKVRQTLPEPTRVHARNPLPTNDRDVRRPDGVWARRELESLALWKDADLDIPILEQAKAEYAKLR